MPTEYGILDLPAQSVDSCQLTARLRRARLPAVNWAGFLSAAPLLAWALGRSSQVAMLVLGLFALVSFIAPGQLLPRARRCAAR